MKSVGVVSGSNIIGCELLRGITFRDQGTSAVRVQTPGAVDDFFNWLGLKFELVFVDFQ